jgi:threonine dehydrogenase-like Zn-dependent dehydrogenase
LEGFIIMQPNNLEIKIVAAAICGTQFSNSDFCHEGI